MANFTYTQRRTRLNLIRDEIARAITINDKAERLDTMLTAEGIQGVTVATEVQEVLDDGGKIVTSILFQLGTWTTELDGGMFYTDGTDNFFTRA